MHLDLGGSDGDSQPNGSLKHEDGTRLGEEDGVCGDGSDAIEARKRCRVGSCRHRERCGSQLGRRPGSGLSSAAGAASHVATVAAVGRGRLRVVVRIGVCRMAVQGEE